MFTTDASARIQLETRAHDLRRADRERERHRHWRETLAMSSSSASAAAGAVDRTRPAAEATRGRGLPSLRALFAR